MNGTYNCTCKSGFTGNGTICDNINECQIKDTCHRQAVCSDTEGSFKCKCKKGFVGNGTKCRDMDECRLNAPCRSFMACLNTFGSYNCAGMTWHCSLYAVKCSQRCTLEPIIFDLNLLKVCNSCVSNIRIVQLARSMKHNANEILYHCETVFLSVD